MELSDTKYYYVLVLILVALISQSHSCDDQRPKVNAITTPCGLSRKTTNVLLGAAPSCAVAVILFVVLFHLCIRHCSPDDNTNPSSASSAAGEDVLNREAIEKCPVFDYSTMKEMKMGKEAMECSVCLGEFEEWHSIKMLPKCQHVFHQQCIDTWLPSRMTCPICRQKLTSDTNIDIDSNVPIPTEQGTAVTAEEQPAEA